MASPPSDEEGKKTENQEVQPVTMDWDRILSTPVKQLKRKVVTMSESEFLSFMGTSLSSDSDSRTILAVMLEERRQYLLDSREYGSAGADKIFAYRMAQDISGNLATEQKLAIVVADCPDTSPMAPLEPTF
eukprot:TRINITY_DN8422_c0_g1_i1.p1 TRINITY_DN8422_c0_g1~~TRINITY_DN8422_c0_g1_i1.p1  ORF type:complete len:131 (-),score=22.54 TRINITY_DN8422_c0_g1_i1:163-555(-)